MHPQFPIDRILIAIDFSDSARQAFYAGISLARKFDAETWVLHVSEPLRSFDFGRKRYVETKETIERVEAGIRRRLDELWSEGGLEAVDRRKVHILVRGGKAASEIVQTARAKKTDVIIMGAGGEGGLGAFMGSTAERVVRNAPCSVFAIRPTQGQEQEEPVAVAETDEL